MPTTRSLSKRNSSPLGGGCAIVFATVFCLVFATVGFGVMYFTTGRTLWNVWSAKSWQPAQCEITFSQVAGAGSHSRDTSRVDIQYRFTWNGQRFTGKRYDFSVGSDNFNNAAKVAIVAQHQPGQMVACFVDPADPTQSVINRDMKWGYLFGLAFGAPFALVPIAILGAVLYGRRKMRQSQALAIPGAATLPGITPVPVPASASPFGSTPVAGSGFGSATTFGSPSINMGVMTAVAGGPVVLKPESSRIGRLIGMILLCLFWNGIVGIFTWFELSGGFHSDSWFLTLFLIPFQLIGLGLAWGVISSVLALSNPKPVLTLSNAWIPVGGTITLQWKMTGAARRLRNLNIVLRGREEAHYRRGTDSYTDKHTFHETQVLETTESSRIAMGMASVSIPANSMHSFASDDNKIVWSLQVTGEIVFWPDVDETFDLVVRPR
jgi:hypothetical protein